jgi:glycosyltransferase involved in cell wall biosynthesis
MNLPRITIVTPSFNQAATLERTLRSVLDQDYPELEYFVIDGGSTDGSVEIIRRFESRLAGWVSENDAGQTDAINKGLARATGEIIAYLNSDDVYLPGTLRHVAALMSGDDAVEWLIGGCRMIDLFNADQGRFEHHMPRSFLSYLMRSSGMLPQPSCFWSARMFEDHGGFDPDLHYAFDYEFHCRLLASGERPRLIERDLAALRLHEQSKSSRHVSAFGHERIAVARRYADRLPMKQRYTLWRNIDYRQRLYTLQEAAMSRALLLTKVATHPWWLASAEVRAALIDPQTLRSAA